MTSQQLLQFASKVDAVSRDLDALHAEAPSELKGDLTATRITLSRVIGEEFERLLGQTVLLERGV